MVSARIEHGPSEMNDSFGRPHARLARGAQDPPVDGRERPRSCRTPRLRTPGKPDAAGIAGVYLRAELLIYRLQHAHLGERRRADGLQAAGRTGNAGTLGLAAVALIRRRYGPNSVAEDAALAAAVPQH